MMFLIPLFVVGVWLTTRIMRIDRRMGVLLIFLELCFLLGVVAVAATSLDTRHLAQFVPAFLVVATVPDVRKKAIRKMVWWTQLSWLSAIGFVHLMWAITKGWI